MPRGNGGVLGPANIPTTSVAKGVWSLMEQQLAQRQGIWPAGPAPIVPDPYFDYTTLLLPGNGTNGAQNNTFLDSSTNNFTITRNGNTTQGTFSPFSQTGWGNYFGTSGHALGVSNGLIQTTDTTFTMECWVYMLSNPTGGNPNTFPVLIGQMDQTAGEIRLALGPDGNGKLNFYWYDGSNKNVISTTTIQLNTWTHIAVSVNSNAITLYINGTSSGTGTLTNRNSLQNTFYIGNHYTTVYNYVGYVSQVRVVSGVAVYTGNFTPPTSLLTATQSSGTNISAITTGQTKLLTCQSNRFVDNGQGNTSNTPFAITVAGSPSVQAFSPFNPSASWSAATYGGSGYFDGNSDYLTAPDNTALDLSGSISWCIELWAYWNNLSGEQSLLEKFLYTPAGWTLYKQTTNVLEIYNGSTTISSGVTVTTGQWYQIVLCRDNATNTFSIFVNGVRALTSSATIASNAATPLVVGARTSNSNYFNGYISNARIVKGSAVYDPTQTTLTVPTAPLTNITNTSLLLNYTNAGIYDATSKNDLETVGNAQISTAQSKFGGSSMYFDGTGDYLDVSPSGFSSFGTGNFTVEFWMRTAGSSFNIINPATATGTGYWALLVVTGSGGFRWNDAYNITNLWTQTATSVLDNNWHHIAVVRNGTGSGNVNIYFDGVAQGTAKTDSTNYNGASTAWRIGSGNVGAFNGYIQDLRITPGIARYTANFTAPTAAFPTL